MNISIVIPNYNGKHLLDKNLDAVIYAINYYLDTFGGKGEIIIVDDKSTDGSIDFIKKKIKEHIIKNIEIRLFENQKNLGFSSTANRGVKETTYNYVVLMNSDVNPRKDFLIPLLSHFDDEKVFAVGCMDESIENSNVVLRGRGIGKWKRGFLVHAAGNVDKNTTLWVSGGSSAFRKGIWEKLGGFNELYNPFYWEDIDLSYRALKSGYKLLFEQKSIVVHNHEEGIIKKKYSDSQIKTIAYKNQFIFVWNTITDLDLLINHVLWLPYHIITAFLRRDKAFTDGFFAAFFCLPKIIKSKMSHNFYIRNDKEVLKNFLE